MKINVFKTAFFGANLSQHGNIIVYQKQCEWQKLWFFQTKTSNHSKGAVVWTEVVNDHMRPLAKGSHMVITDLRPYNCTFWMVRGSRLRKPKLLSFAFFLIYNYITMLGEVGTRHSSFEHISFFRLGPWVSSHFCCCFHLLFDFISPCSHPFLLFGKKPSVIVKEQFVRSLTPHSAVNSP
jgi:hypothetical protein